MEKNHPCREKQLKIIIFDINDVYTGTGIDQLRVCHVGPLIERHAHRSI